MKYDLTKPLEFCGKPLTIEKVLSCWTRADDISWGTDFFPDQRNLSVVTNLMYQLNKREMRLDAGTGPFPCVVTPAYFKKIMASTMQTHSGYHGDGRKDDFLKMVALSKKAFVETMLQTFLESIMMRPKTLVDRDTGRVAAKGKYSLLKISRAVKSKEEFAWLLHAMLTGSKDLSVTMIDDHTISLELVGVEVSNRPTSENTLLAGKVASAIADITNLQPREAYQMYEILVLGVKLPDIQYESWNRSAVGFSPLVTPEAAEAAKDLVAFPKGCRELNIESYYPVYFLPTIDIEEFEEKVAEMTATVKRLRELKDMHKDRYPSTVKEVMIKIVEAICLNYMNYMNHTSNTDIKFMGLLANAVAQGYETDKILQRLGKALDAKHI